MTFVSVGNARQPFYRLLNEVAAMASKLPQPVVVQHGYTAFECSICRASAFMDMEEFVLNIRNAKLLIMHAGAGSIIHAIEVGKTPVIMPRRASFREHVNDHQIEFAEAMAKAGRVIMIENLKELEIAVAEALSVKKSVELVAGNSRMLSLVRNKLEEIASKIDTAK